MQPEAAARVATLEAELRRGMRREEKLQAMQYRLREDCKDPAVFDTLRAVRDLEYDIEFQAKRHAREMQV